MKDTFDILAGLIQKKLRGCFPRLPSRGIIRRLLVLSYHATLKSEEGRPVRGSITFANPNNPDPDPPIIRRADFPGFTSFKKPRLLTLEVLVKLSRAVDKWSGSIAVSGKSVSQVYAWGVVDQIVHQSVLQNREARHGFAHPGVLTIVMEGLGELAIYHGSALIARLSQQEILGVEHDVLISKLIQMKLLPVLYPVALKVKEKTKSTIDPIRISNELHAVWADTLSRLCISLRRLGTGGTFVLSPKPKSSIMDIGYSLEYERLRDGFILGVVESLHQSNLRSEVDAHGSSEPRSLHRELRLVKTDQDDRDRELRGAVRFVTGLASADGAVLVTPLLEVKGFGVKLKAKAQPIRVYDGPNFIRRGALASKVDLSRYGTRHGSALQYCKIDPNAICIIVSQDGSVRLATTVGRSVLLWEYLRLLRYDDDVKRYIEINKAGRKRRSKERHRVGRGYGDMPKTFRLLMR